MSRSIKSLNSGVAFLTKTVVLSDAMHQRHAGMSEIPGFPLRPRWGTSSRVSPNSSRWRRRISGVSAGTLFGSGATQDLLALNIDLASVMQAGRWKTNRMPMRYGEHVLAARGGMARAAEAQGRDKL